MTPAPQGALIQAPRGSSLTRLISRETNMITLTAAEEDLQAFLIQMARSAASHDLTAPPRTLLKAGVTMAYGEMARELDPDRALGWDDGGHYKRLTRALFHVNTYQL